ncbi:unnamed protein product, partial [Medioppia subpectinata]
MSVLNGCLNKSPPNSANSITTTTATAAIKVKPTANKPPVPYKPPGLNQKSAPGKQTTQHQPSAPDSQGYQTGITKYTPTSVLEDNHDTGSIKSETSSLCRPLKFGGHTDGGGDDIPVDGNGNQLIDSPFIANPNDNVYKPCEQNSGTIGSRATRFPTLGQCSRGNNNDSQDSERTVCCHNLAIDLYNKALESAKRALPTKSSKQSRQQFPRSFGEDFESIGPEGFNYLDDGQTECSYDYRDIDYNRDSIIRPDVFAHMDVGVPVLVGDVDTGDESPRTADDLRRRYGLPDKPDRVQPYVPSGAPSKTCPISTAIPLSEFAVTKPIVQNKVLVVDGHQDTDGGVIVKASDSTGATVLSDIAPEPNPITATTVSHTQTVPERKASTSRPMVLALSAGHQTQIAFKPADNRQTLSAGSPVSATGELMDSMAKRTSQLIIDTAIHESIARRLTPSPSGAENQDNRSNESKADPKSKKSSADSATVAADKEVAKRERKLLEKRLKEEEKQRRKAEKLIRDEDRAEKKSLFARFRTEDRQKKKIQKKQKQFEKIRQKSMVNKSKNSLKSDDNVDIEADDEYEPSPVPPPTLTTGPTVDRFGRHTYEDIDAEPVVTSGGAVLTANTDVEVVAVDVQLVLEDVPVKYEYIENVREIGVTYMPSNDNSGAEDTDTETVQPVAKKGSKRGSKSPKPAAGAVKSSSFRALKSKVKDIFPAHKWTPKLVRKSGKHTGADITGHKKQQSVVPSIIVVEDPALLQHPEFVCVPSPTPTPTDFQREYENITGDTFNSDQTVPIGADSEPTYDMSTASGTSGATTVVGTAANSNTGASGATVSGMASQYETEEDDEEQQFLERVSRVEGAGGRAHKKHRQKSKARAKLDRLKAKAMESLPKITSIVPLMKDFVSARRTQSSTAADRRQHRDLEYERYRQIPTRYDSDFDCVSDSELCDSLNRRTGRMDGPEGRAEARHHVYEEMAATQERLDSYMSPVSGPLRPPRRFSGMKYAPKVASTPTLSTQVLVRVPKRSMVPPPRPPPPTPRPSIVVDNIDDDQRPALVRKQRVPADIYYTNVRLNYKPKRRFISGRARAATLAHRTHTVPTGMAYDSPKPLLPVPLKACQTRVQALNAYNTALAYGLKAQTLPPQSAPAGPPPLLAGATGATRNWTPTPPPRRGRSRRDPRSQTQAVDQSALDWQPFTWKWRRCRSLTELDVRNSRQSSPVATNRRPNSPNKGTGSSHPPLPPSVPPQPAKIIQTHSKRPTRPPPPTISHSMSASALSSGTCRHDRNARPLNDCLVSDSYHIYSSVCKGVDTSHTAGAQPTQHDWSRRPLPAPPRPPKPKARRSLSTTTRDASVSTQDIGLNAWCDRETQLDARNNSLWEDSVNGMDMLGDPNDPYRTPTNPLTPTTPTNPPHMAFGTAYDDGGDLTAAHTYTSSTTNWYDAEPPAPGNVPPRSPPAHRRDRDWDQDTINDDVSSIASNYQSFASEYTTRADDDDGDDNVDEVMDRYGDEQYGDREETPVAEVTDVDDVGGHVVAPPPQPLSSDYTPTVKTACKTAVRSQSTRAAPDAGSHSPGRRSLPTS